MVEESDGEIWPDLAQQLRNELQLVVLDPDHRFGRAGLRCGIREPLVDLDIAVPPLAVIAGRRDNVVVERPEGVVGKTLVVPLDLEGTQSHRDDVDSVAVERAEFQVGLPAPADPGALVLLHDRLESRDQTAGRAAPAGGAIACDNAVDREAVGHDDEVVGAAGRWSHCALKVTAPRAISIARWLLPGSTLTAR